MNPSDPRTPDAAAVSTTTNTLKARRIDLDTRDRPVAVMRSDCPVCRAEGFKAHVRVRLDSTRGSIIATLYHTGAGLLDDLEIGLSAAASKALQVRDGDPVHASHPKSLESIGRVRAKVHGNKLDRPAFDAIMNDIVRGRYDDIEMAMFLTAIAARSLDDDELAGLTGGMVAVGKRLTWDQPVRVDKHCIGGLPNNRTTPIIVAIAAANGLIIPKTSSRAITSPAGTADTMEMLAPVNLDLDQMRRVVGAEGGCVVWGGAVGLSPVDDMLIRVVRVMDLDSEAQIVASVLSKKIAAGATHLVLDLPVGETAKVRSHVEGEHLADRLRSTAAAFGLEARTVITDGRQPIGRGIGPALEAHDVLAVLQGAADQPADLRDRAVMLAGELLELGKAADAGRGRELAVATLESGAAWEKFEAICAAQGGLRKPPVANATREIPAPVSGRVVEIDNRRLGRVAKLAGAPAAPAAGVLLHVHLGDPVEAGQPLYTVHAETGGELAYAHEFAGANGDIVRVGGDS